VKLVLTATFGTKLKKSVLTALTLSRTAQPVTQALMESNVLNAQETWTSTTRMALVGTLTVN